MSNDPRDKSTPTEATESSGSDESIGQGPKASVKESSIETVASSGSVEVESNSSKSDVDEPLLQNPKADESEEQDAKANADSELTVPAVTASDNEAEALGEKSSTSDSLESPSTDNIEAAANAKADTPPPPVAAKKGGVLKFIFSFLLLLIFCGALGVAGYFGWMWMEEQRQLQAQQSQQVAAAEEEIRRLETAQSNLTSVLNDLRSREQQQQGELNQFQDGVDQLDSRVEAHSRRLQQLSTTNRDDWLLAEAEYLVRLANHRILLERGPQGALALLVAADNIMVEIDDIDLFAVRKQLSRDIAALKLAPEVDRSGLYLQLSALAEQVLALPMSPPKMTITTQETPTTEAEANSDSVWGRLKQRFQSAMNTFNDQVRIQRHDQPIEPLLPPDSASYLRQNIRFNLEQGQLALLRGEQKIFHASLGEAVELLREYFAERPEAQRIAQELEVLAREPVAEDMPDISGSLKSLESYVARLHLLDSEAGKPQLDAGQQ